MFIQAGNSVFAVFMIYKVVGPEIGAGPLPELIIELKDRANLKSKILILAAFAFTLFILMLPQLIVSKTLANNMLKTDDESLEPLYEEGLLIREDEDTVLISDANVKTLNSVITIIFFSILFSALGLYAYKN